MLSPGVAVITSTKLALLLCGALGGYLVVMCTNPVRSSFRDGWRIIRRYSAIWLVLGLLSFAHAAFDLGIRWYFHEALPPAERPEFRMWREAMHDPELKFTGSPESIWWLPREDFIDALPSAWLPALESLAGVFNLLSGTFPIAAPAALLLLFNFHGHHGTLHRALRRRFRRAGLLLHLLVIACAVAALVKPLLYAAPALSLSPAAAKWWWQWGPVIEWLAFLFEYLFGVFIQVALLLLAFGWVRGLSFARHEIVDFAIRRLSYVVKWALVVMALSSVLINAPLILKNFEAFAHWFPSEESLNRFLGNARAGLAVFLLCFATVQVSLTLHSESLKRAFGNHFAFLARHWWPFGWYLVVAALHFAALQVLHQSILRGVGEGTALWVSWRLIFPWIAAVIGGWLLASWVAVFKRCEANRTVTTPAMAAS